MNSTKLLRIYTSENAYTTTLAHQSPVLLGAALPRQNRLL